MTTVLPLVLGGCIENDFHWIGDEAEPASPPVGVGPGRTPGLGQAPEDPDPALDPVADAGPDRAVDALTPVALDGSASVDPNGEGITTWTWRIVAAPEGASATLSLAEAPVVELVPDLDGTWELELAVQNAAGRWDPTPDRVTVTAAPLAPIAKAGDDLVHEPLDRVVLDATGSFDPLGHEPLDYTWMPVSIPPNATAALDDPTSPTPSFVADLAGEYVFDLSVSNALGIPDPSPDRVIVTTTPADGFYVELSWAGDADLDLHLLNGDASGPFDCPDDCNYDAPSPDWGGPGDLDDPSLDADTIPGVAGLGPEIVTIEEPAPDTYTVLVHHYGEGGWPSCGSCPDAAATVRIYLGGVLAASFTDTLEDDGQVWEVATITWPSGLVTESGARSTTHRTECF